MKLKIIILSCLVGSCSNNVDYNYPQDPVNQRKSRAGKFFNDDVILYGKNNKNSDNDKLAINNKLFLNAHKVLQEIADIDILDPEAGILSTKWKFGKNKDYKTKITIIIKGSEMTEDNIKISIVRKYLENKQWIDKEPDDPDMIKSLIKSKTITANK